MQPVIVRRALFCIICSLFMLVVEIVGDHIVEAYSSMGREMAL